MRHISDLLAEGLATLLEDELVKAGEEPGLVRSGRLQENPVKLESIVLVHIGDPEKPGDWDDISAAVRGAGIDRSQIDIPAFEIGGGEMWWRRLAVSVDYYGMKSKPERDEARQLANALRGRVEQILRRNKSSVRIVDDFGEQSIMMMVLHSYMIEGGGPKDQFIWRGIIRLQVLTEIPY